MNALMLLLSVAFSQTPSWYQAALELQTNAGLKSNDSLVAVIDTGVDINHPALQNSFWTNPGESGFDSAGKNKKTNGVDDDQNGFIDDVHGWNFAQNNPDITDDHGHGTHIAGLISADQKIFKGIAPGTKLMILKYYDPNASGGGANLMNTVRAVKYALLMGATIINYSGGGSAPHALEKQVFQEADRKNVLVVAAAGNESTNSDLLGFYPASYAFKNILSVMAVGPDLKRVPSSNWGSQNVKIAAPGEQILSLLPNNKWGIMSGTSQATALMTGLAVIMKQKRPDLKTPEDLIKVLVASGQYNPNLLGQLHHPAKVSAKRALYMAADFSSEEEKSLSNFRP